MILTNQSTKSLKDQHAIAVQINGDEIIPMYVDLYDILDIYLKKTSGESDITGGDGTVLSYTDRFNEITTENSVIIQDNNANIADNDSATATIRKYDQDMRTYCSKANKEYSEVGQYESDPTTWSQHVGEFDYSGFIDNPDNLTTIFNSEFSDISDPTEPRSSSQLNDDLNTFMKTALQSIGIQITSSEDDSLILTVDEVNSGSNKITADAWHKTTS